MAQKKKKKTFLLREARRCLRDAFKAKIRPAFGLSLAQGRYPAASEARTPQHGRRQGLHAQLAWRASGPLGPLGTSLASLPLRVSSLPVVFAYGLVVWWCGGFVVWWFGGLVVWRYPRGSSPQATNPMYLSQV